MMARSHPAPLTAEPPAIEPRQAEILVAVRQAFVEKGFDGASMQDLARAAGMSVGNFYRYFPSKSAIIRAMVLLDAQEIQRDFDTILAAPDPMAALRAGLNQRIFGPSCAHDSALWAEIEAASRRSPEVAEAHQLIGAQVRASLIGVFAAATRLPIDEANRHFSAHAAFLLMLFKAASCVDPAQCLDTSGLRDIIARTIHRQLDEILLSAAPLPD